MRKTIKWLAAPLILVAGYFLGPQPDFPPLESAILPFEGTLEDLPEKIAAAESQIANLKPGNEAHILWADSIRRTPYCIVFLHGFSASPREGDPIVLDFARRYGINLYLPRLSGHGIQDPEAFQNLHPQDLINSAREAIGIGRQLGEKVIVMGSSTGCTLGAYLAAKNPGAVAALMLYSPNFAIANGAAPLMSKPWGLQLAQLAHGGSNYHTWEPETPEVHKYWTTSYRVESLVCLQALLDQTMQPEIFNKIDIPVFTGYYYKNEEEKDPVISTDAILTFMNTISTPEDQRRSIAFPDVRSHVITCDFQCKDLESVRRASFAFAEEILGLQPIR